MIAPLLLVLFASRRTRPTRARLLEGAALLGSVAAVSAVVFLAGAWRYPYLIFPLLLWGALRFRQFGAATTAFLVGAIGTWGAVEGTIPIAAVGATARVQVSQALFVLIAVSLLVVGATLSEREEGRRALAETAARLGEVQALAHLGSWAWDIRRDVVSWSDELYRIFGLPRPGEPVSYAAYLDRIHPEDRAYVDETVARALAEQRPFALEHRVVRPDGSERVVFAQGDVVVEDGRAVAMLGTAQDVTDRRQAERLREDMLAAVSHELRTPLTSVLGFALTLQERRDELSDAQIDEIVRELAGGASRLEALLVDLLDVERARRGLVQVRRRETDVRMLLERAVAPVRLGGRRVEVRADPVAANVDAAKLERIVENLVANAVKHTPPESAIEVRVEREDGDLLLVVEDEGPGIAAEFKDEIFETFNRGPSMLSATPGAGIGLSLVAHFAAVHGGRSWVEDRPGGGASFRVLLPDCVVPSEAAERA
jgi:PAS domain S-box-containing protein